ncbi:MAG: tRNA-dihydrouridine synthase [Solirubrobacteraceae bacterium]|nr:tRNA-dihydrouridine synthase [Solirubrobacteraceae bacterium]
MTQQALSEPFEIGGVHVPNRVALAPLAGIGNWFVRLQARRHGAGLVVSEMVSSFAIHHGNRKTLTELLRIDPRERTTGPGGPVAIQLFGQDPDVMRSAAATVAERGADIIDINMGCPVPKVCRTGAGAALLRDPARAVAVARAAREGSGLPVTVKLRSGLRAGERDGFELALRLVEEAGVSAIGFHPRSAQVQHKGTPDLELAALLVERLAPTPVVLSGGLRDERRVLDSLAATGAAAVMLARGVLGNPWLFGGVLGLRSAEPGREEVLTELDWLIGRAVEHLGAERAARYLRKLYPPYLERLGASKADQAALQGSSSIVEARALIEAFGTLAAAP